VPIVGVEPFPGFGSWKDHLVAAEELDERGPVRSHLLPALLDFRRVPEDQFGLFCRQFDCDLRDLRGTGPGVGRHRPGDQPGFGHRANGHQADVHEPALGQLAESVRAHVGVHAVLQVIEQVQQHNRFLVLAADLEDPLHRFMPAAQQLTVSRSQVRPTGQELVQHGLAARQAVLEREPVDDADRFSLAQHRPGTRGLPYEQRQVPFKPRAACEVDQGTLQSGASLDEGAERWLAATMVHACNATSLLRPAEHGQLAVNLRWAERLGPARAALGTVLDQRVAIVPDVVDDRTAMTGPRLAGRSGKPGPNQVPTTQITPDCARRPQM
jgi:hypothetical protein